MVNKSVIRLISCVIFIQALTACVFGESYLPTRDDIKVSANEKSGFVILTVSESGYFKNFQFPHIRVDNKNDHSTVFMFIKKVNSMGDYLLINNSVSIDIPNRPEYIELMNPIGGFAIYKLPAGEYRIISYESSGMVLRGGSFLTFPKSKPLNVDFTLGTGEYKYVGNFNFHYFADNNKFRFRINNEYQRDIKRLKQINSLFNTINIVVAKQISENY